MYPLVFSPPATSSEHAHCLQVYIFLNINLVRGFYTKYKPARPIENVWL